MNYGDISSKGSLGGVKEFAKANGLSFKEAKRRLEGVDAYALYKPVRRKIKRQKIVGYFINELHVADLAEVFQAPFYPEDNEGVKYLLVIVDSLSRICYIRPLIDKKSATVSGAMRKIYNDPSKRCDLLLTDQGTEFRGSCEKVYKDFKINHYHTQSTEIKGSHAERKILDLKRMLSRYMHYNNTRKYVGVLPLIEKNLNGRNHRIIGMPPAKVKKSHETDIFIESIRSGISKQKFKIGDPVRLSSVKMVWDKSHRGGWSLEIFKIYKIDKKPIVCYYLKDLEDKPLSGKFFFEEIHRVAKPDFF